MDSRSLNAFRADIGKLSTRKLVALEKQEMDAPHPFGGRLLEAMDSGAYDAFENDRWTKIDAIRDELSGREHDLQDASSGLGGVGPS